MADAAARREALKEVFHAARGCTACPELAASRHTVVFGSGNADADLMFVGEAPGRNEDERGLPFVGQAGALLERLLAEVGLKRSDVFIANVLKCRPPGNRDPHPAEVERCQEWLWQQLDLVQPSVVCSLGNFATKLLRGDPTGITKLHGKAEVRVLGPRAVRLYPLLHPAAALYTPQLQETLRRDFARLPELLAMPAPTQPADVEPPAPPEPVPAPEPEAAPRPAPGPEPEAAREPVLELTLVDESEMAAHEAPAADDGVRDARAREAAQLGLF